MRLVNEQINPIHFLERCRFDDRHFVRGDTYVVLLQFITQSGLHTTTTTTGSPPPASHQSILQCSRQHTLLFGHTRSSFAPWKMNAFSAGHHRFSSRFQLEIVDFGTIIRCGPEILRYCFRYAKSEIDSDHHTVTNVSMRDWTAAMRSRSPTTTYRVFYPNPFL